MIIIEYRRPGGQWLPTKGTYWQAKDRAEARTTIRLVKKYPHRGWEKTSYRIVNRKSYMLKTAINSKCLQQVLDSATNAAQKGQAQYFTPLDWAKALGQGLPNYRPCVVDFTCGHGHLLAGTAGQSTTHLLGCDIDPTTSDSSSERELAPSAPLINSRRVTADITKFFPLLRSVKWQFDVGAFNPPFDHHQYRDRVAMLASSHCPAVRHAFAAHDGRTSLDTIDSTSLMIMMALDRMTEYGEAFLIANQATFDRLILADDAPHYALRNQIWANVIIPGNICSPDPRPQTPDPDGFHTGVIYFARDHDEGFNETVTVTDIGQCGTHLRNPSFRSNRHGAKLRPGVANLDSPKLWAAAKEEWEVLQSSSSSSSSSKWNLWLDTAGRIITNLSTFDEASGRVNKQEAARLHELNGQVPIHLVMQVAKRRELERAALGTRWRVAPAVIEAVKAAIADYERARSPLYPLNEIQRLGYIDEKETILCLKNLPQTPDPRRQTPDFIAGTRYALRTETVRTIRDGTKMNLEGSLDDVQYDGAELAIFLDSGAGEKLFMEARHRATNVLLSIQDKGKPSPINYTLEQLVECFEIPEVPDVATVNPAGYEANLALLHEIEQLVA